jgi:hypothetical protein
LRLERIPLLHQIIKCGFGIEGEQSRGFGELVGRGAVVELEPVDAGFVAEQRCFLA